MFENEITLDRFLARPLLQAVQHTFNFVVKVLAQLALSLADSPQEGPDN